MKVKVYTKDNCIWCDRAKGLLNAYSIEFEEVALDHINVKRYVKGKGEWQTLDITMYDPIVPSASQAVMECCLLYTSDAADE